jgi:probable 2-oxoglutarate dehydrogenase E1 component DHKTD1
MLRNYRKPLVIASPKVMLRHPSCVSSLADMAPGTTFQPVISDPSVDAASVKRILIVSGKHYYALMKERDIREVKDTAIIRLEVSQNANIIISEVF